MIKRDSSILLNISFIIGLFILILNDFVLKQWYPNILTGKLSDFSGLFIFPIFLTYLLPSKKKTFYIFTFIVFVLWKLPLADLFINYWNKLSVFNINRVIDYTDYFALIVLPFSYFHKPKQLNLPHQRLVVNLVGIVSFIAFCSTSGTHGSIKGYEYPTSKENLENAISEVINENSEINRPDTISEKDYYNTGGYITISISAPEKYNYTFRFYGGEEHWLSSPNKSEIFICYAHDNKGNGGSEGGVGVEWYKFGVKTN